MPNLILGFRYKQRALITVGETTIVVTALEITGNHIRLGFEAPVEVHIGRERPEEPESEVPQ